ncbi:protein kinase C delta type-like [Dendropsophus ebraccatus]|uniref:protein kinase C delta type-like n=1 Tax=Dendropsophus ebraccatus TaxID=150705 RepID=UPI0038320224
MSTDSERKAIMEEEKEVFVGRKRVEKRKHLLDSSLDEKASIKKAKRSGGKRKRTEPGGKTSDTPGMDPAENEDVITQGRGPKKRRTRDCSEDEKKPSMKTDGQKNKDLQEDPGGSGCSGVRPTGPGTISGSIKERLLFHHVLGQGSYGTVMMAEDTVSHRQYAVKLIRKSDLLTGSEEYMMVEKRVLLLASGSPFLVHAEFALQTKMHVLFGMQYMTCGDFNQLLQLRGPLDITDARFYAAEIVCGIQFLHSKGVIHRDLKPDNILVADTGHVKITDFGLAIDNMHGDRTATSCAGTLDYMAPEMLAQKKYSAGVDWYSFGVILNEMLTSEREFDPTFFDETSSGAKNIIQLLLQKHPAKRLGVHGNIRGHRFFQRMNWISVEALKLTPPVIPEPTEITPRFRPFKLDKIEAAEATSSITPAAQAKFRGFSFANWETLNKTPAQE